MLPQIINSIWGNNYERRHEIQEFFREVSD